MPIGLSLMKWDEREGVSILTTYPKDITITTKNLMQIYATHEYTGQQGTISLQVGAFNILSYYMGRETGLYLILLLSSDESAEQFEDAMADAMRLIYSNFNDNAYESLIPSIFQRLTIYPTLNDEQQLINNYIDGAKRFFFEQLQENGSLFKSELGVMMMDQYREGFIDIENLVYGLAKESLVKSLSIKGMLSEALFLINDLYVTRVPPITALKNTLSKGFSKEIASIYKKQVTSFFSEYLNTNVDNIVTLNTLSDPQVYEVVKLMRDTIVTRDDLDKLQKKGVKDMDDVLKKLWDAKMTLIIRDKKGNEYYGLLTDVKIVKIFPEYILNKIRTQYSYKIKNDDVLIEYLKVLKDYYLNTIVISR